MSARVTSTTVPERAGAEHCPFGAVAASRKAPLAAAQPTVDMPASTTVAAPAKISVRVLSRMASRGAEQLPPAAVLVGVDLAAGEALIEDAQGVAASAQVATMPKVADQEDHAGDDQAP